jgi:hypothetical protein
LQYDPSDTEKLFLRVTNHTFVLKSFIKDNAPEFDTVKLKSSAEACERFSV